MHPSNRNLFSNSNKGSGLFNQRSSEPSPFQSIKFLLDKDSELIDMSLNALLNTSCNKIEDVMSNSNKPPISPQTPSRGTQADEIIANQSRPNSNTTTLDDDGGPSLEILTAGQNPRMNSNTGSFIVLQGQNMFEDIDFWLIFDNIQANTSVNQLMEQLRNQFESINIVKVKQAYYLDRQRQNVSRVTGWKLFDKSSADEIIKRTKELMLCVNNTKLKYEVIGSTQELRNYLRKNEQDQRLSQANLFQDEYAVPLLKLQLQGLFYYEFDYVDISPETVFVICGLPMNINNAKLKEYLNENELPEPVNILRNEFEGETCVRLTFGNKNEADLFRFKGFKVPLKGPFTEKPLIIMPIKDRGFDYFTQLLKYQVMVDFEANEDHTLQSKIEVLKKIQSSYGLVSDVNILYSELWIITFLHFDSATKCMDNWQFDEFSLKLSFSKPSTSHMLTGYLFQIEAPMTRTTQTPTRPPPLLRVDPTQLKIKSEQFEKNQNLKRRYQKVYLLQKESSANESKQAPVEFYNNDIKEKLEPLPSVAELQVMQIEEQKPLEKPDLSGVKDEDEEIPITIHEEIFKELPASKNMSPKKNKRKSSAPKRKTELKEDKKYRVKEDGNNSLNGKRNLSPRDTSLEKPKNKIVHKNDDGDPRVLSPPKQTSFVTTRARKTILKSQEDLRDKMHVESSAETSKVKEKNNLEGEQIFIQKNIEKIKSLIKSHHHVRKNKNVEDVEVKEEEEQNQEEEQDREIEKPKSWKNEKIVAKAKKGSRIKK